MYTYTHMHMYQSHNHIVASRRSCAEAYYTVVDYKQKNTKYYTLYCTIVSYDILYYTIMLCICYN